MNECGECDLCCKLLETHGVPSKIGEYCKYCDNGCTIYNDRPSECREYQCMWTQMPARFATLAMRPDQCGIIFDRQKGNVISARMEEGMKLNDFLVGQINSFNREGFSVIIFRGKESKLFLVEGHTKQYVEDIIHGRSAVFHRSS